MKKKLCLIFFLLIVWAAIGFVIYNFVKGYFQEKKKEDNATYEVLESVTIESGEELPAIKDYFKDKKAPDAKIKYLYRGVEVSETDGMFFYTKGAVKYSKGTYEIDVEIVDKLKYKSKLIIKDETAPEVTLKKMTVKSYTDYQAKEFVDKYSDNSSMDDYTAEFIGEIHKTVGNYDVSIKICDVNGNCTEQVTSVEIIPGDVEIGSYKLTYGRYVGEVCDENTGVGNCRASIIYVYGDNTIKLNDSTVKHYIRDGYNLILSNGEVFKVIGNDKLEYQNRLKSVYVYSP